jgi:integrase
MPRTVRDSALETRTARARLRPRAWPYWRALEPNVHLGYYRPLTGPGAWKRRLRDDGAYVVDHLGLADDYADANGREILSYAQAQRTALKPQIARRGITVNAVLDRYLAHLRADGRTAAAIRDTNYRFNAVRPKLGDVELGDVSTKQLKRWLHDQVKDADPDEEAQRRARASANRNWTSLRAALNLAFADDLIDSDKAWRKLKPFRGVERARIRYLDHAEVARLDNAIDPEFQPLLRAALFVGCRYGALCALKVADFNADAGTLRLSTRKGDGSVKVYHVHLSEAAQAFFAARCAGRAGADLIFRRRDGAAFAKSHQIRPLAEASLRAGIDPAVSFHVLRHTFASHAVMAGTPLLVVANALGHTDCRMIERHYGHLSEGFQATAIRRGAPDFKFKLERATVVGIKR